MVEKQTALPLRRLVSVALVLGVGMFIALSGRSHSSQQIMSAPAGGTHRTSSPAQANASTTSTIPPSLDDRRQIDDDKQTIMHDHGSAVGGPEIASISAITIKWVRWEDLLLTPFAADIQQSQMNPRNDDVYAVLVQGTITAGGSTHDTMFEVFQRGHLDASIVTEAFSSSVPSISGSSASAAILSMPAWFVALKDQT